MFGVLLVYIYRVAQKSKPLSGIIELKTISAAIFLIHFEYKMSRRII